MRKPVQNSATELWHPARSQWIALALLALLSAINSQLSTAFAQGTAFTYQGRLNDGPNPANGLYDLRFGLYDAPTSGNQQGNLITNTATAVSNGLFTVTLDFGDQFPGADRWLEIGVQTNGGVSFTTLSPRQQVTPTPYAITAENLNGTIQASQLSSIGNTNGGSGNFFAGPAGNATTTGIDNTASGFSAFINNTSGYADTANGFQALENNTIGNNNTANGWGALENNTNGSFNTANGDQALINNTTGSYNTANGQNALAFNTIGSSNLADGYAALYFNTTGSNNIALGSVAGLNITTGSFNIDIGNQGLAADANIIRIGSGQAQTFIAGVINGNGGGLTGLNVSAAQLTTLGNDNGGFGNFFVGPSGNDTTSGSDNTATGYQALNLNTTGTANTANGYGALYNNTNGNDNTATGFFALYFNTSGFENTANGWNALRFNTSGFGNTAIGAVALEGNTTGFNNTAIGQQALENNTNGIANTAVGYAALVDNTSGSDNTANGFGALLSNTFGSQNTAAGVDALEANTFGSENTADGFEALQNNTVASGNTADGYLALYSNTSGFFNIALGEMAGYNITTGSSNIDIGNEGFSTDTNTIRIGTAQTVTFIAGVIVGDGGGLSDIPASELTSVGNNFGGGDNFFLGPAGNPTTSGSFNTASGFTLNSNTTGVNNTAEGYSALTFNTSGSFNTAYGNGALYSNTNGSANVADGFGSLIDNTSGSDNTAIGVDALAINTSGSNNIAIGFFAGYNNTRGSSNIDIGNQGLATDTNIIRIGSGQTAAYLAGSVGIGVASNNLPQQLLQVGDSTVSGSQGLIRVASHGNGGSAARAWDFGCPIDAANPSDVAGKNFSFAIQDTASTAPNFLIRWDTHYVGIACTNPIALLTVGGATNPAYCDGMNWVNGSDRNAKEDFSPVHPLEVLAKVAALPMTEWQYKATPGQAHLGPMAQDFHAAFGLNGNDDKHIATVDEGGVALAAIQGLNQKVENGNEKIQQLESENADLKARLEKLEQLINVQKGGSK